MFDAPDLAPCLVAPFVALLAGGIVYVAGWIITLVLEKVLGDKFQRSSMIVRRIALVVIPCACVASVMFRVGTLDPQPWFTPTASDIVGTWRLAPEAVQSLERNGFPIIQDHRLVLHQDGTFQVIDVPSFWDWEGPAGQARPTRHMSGSGTWRLHESENQVWFVTFRFSDLHGKDYTDTISFYLEGHLPPYTLRGPLDLIFHKKE